MHDVPACTVIELSEARLSSAMRLANANAAIWAVGNGLISTLLVIYLANDLGASGLALSLILAAPRFAGLLRLGVPALMARVRARKMLCIVAYILSSLVLCGVPTIAALQNRVDAHVAIVLFVTSWCLYHVTEYGGTVTLWSWLGDLTPASTRGELLGRREFWLTAGRILGLVLSAALAAIWAWSLPKAPRWEPLALSAAVGAVMMVIATVPLVFIPGLSQAPSAVPRAPWRSLGRALVDPAYARLLLFYFWFSIANGVSSTAQERFPIGVLNISYTVRQILQGVMRVGQTAIAPWAGRLVDRFGSRPVMIISQLVVSTGMLFYLFASPDRRWPVAGAFIVWSAYAGLNVGLDNIKLKLAPPDNNAPFVSIYYAVGDLANGVTTVIGGVIYDHLVADKTRASSLYTWIFLAGFIGRIVAVPLLAWLIEPGASRVRDIRLKMSSR